MVALASSAMKAALAGGAVGLAFMRIRASKGYNPEQFGFVRPPALWTLGFVATYLAWMLASDAVIHWRGPWDFGPWRQAPLLASTLRVLAVCILGPTAEELIFRSLFFNWLSKRLPMLIVVGTTAVSWAFLHYTYSWSVIAIIVVDGILLGLARWKTGSVVPPILMHAAYNFYAIW